MSNKMNNLLIIVLFESILILSVCFAYLPLYQVANQDLLKGILLGALLSGQKHPHHFVHLSPMPYYSNYMTPQTPYGYTNSNQNAEQSQSQDPEYSEQNDQTNANSQAMTTQSQDQSPQQQKQTQQEVDSRHRQQSEIESQKQQQDMDLHHQLQQQHQQHQHYQHQHQHSNQHQSPQPQPQHLSQQQPQQSESLYDPVLADMQPTHPNTPSAPTQPVIPSMESIQRNLGLGSHSVILMILPTDDKEIQKHYNKSETQTTTEAPIEHSFEQHLVIDDNNIKTNAIKVGSKHLNAKGWKPVPKTSTIATIPDIRAYNRFNNNRYIERSQFGLRNRDFD